MSKGKILVHVCCGPCSTASIERLFQEDWEPVLFFSNSNIYPNQEFIKRWGELLKVAAHYDVPVMMEEQDHPAWLAFVRGLEMEREGGARCTRCFEYNLTRAYYKAKELGIEHFTTTLTVSRFKNSKVIFRVGDGLPGFEEIDFKKKDGFNRSIQLSKELGLYRQHYCGCEFSLRDAEAYEKAKKAAEV